MEERAKRILAAYADNSLLPDAENDVLMTMEDLDRGAIRVASKINDEWIVHDWIKSAILLYFKLSRMQTIEIGPFEYFDKIPVKRNLETSGVRVVPPGIARYASHLEAGAVMMPSYVNIGAYVGAGTMVDTWATVGSCAQIGRNVHLSGGVGIGGVLEPPNARPVIVEDNAFIGSRSIIVEGTHVGQEAVIGANVVLTASTPIIDVTGSEEKVYRGYVPPRSVVVPGTRTKSFPAGEYALPCAIIIGSRSESTDRKVSLNQALRDFNVAV
ncbi:MAG: 2,3,4,5-tetrahydropyridine-2,6-dicarboxylate N-succinyltransferase [Bradymonadia bacterium]